MHLNAKMIAKNLKIFCKLPSKNNKVKEYKKCLSGSDYQKNLIIKLFVQLIMKCIFNEYKNPKVNKSKKNVHLRISNWDFRLYDLFRSSYQTLSIDISF